MTVSPRIFTCQVSPKIPYLLSTSSSPLEFCPSGDDLIDYVGKLGWTIDQEGVVVIPPNTDNTIVSTVVQENVQLPRAYFASLSYVWTTQSLLYRAHQNYHPLPECMIVALDECILVPTLPYSVHDMIYSEPMLQS